MITLEHDCLHFRYPEVHDDAKLSINFQRTLRIPDDDKTYPLPPGLGHFPLRHVDDFAGNVSETWLQRGGVMLPMYQSEAMWIAFSSHSGYPFAVKIAAGKINAVTGNAWASGLDRDPQNYVVIPDQPWLDGFAITKGVIRQFVAMPLGSGYSAEEQITGEGEFGGLQIEAFPIKAEAWQRILAEREKNMSRFRAEDMCCYAAAAPMADMGLAPGGRMTQEIYEDEYDFKDWDLEHGSRCFVHLANSMVWRAITGANPPTTPPTAKEYSRAGLPWFDYYKDGATALPGSKILNKLKSVAAMGREKGDNPLPENEAITPTTVITLRKGLQKDEVREGRF